MNKIYSKKLKCKSTIYNYNIEELKEMQMKLRTNPDWQLQNSFTLIHMNDLPTKWVEQETYLHFLVRQNLQKLAISTILCINPSLA